MFDNLFGKEFISTGSKELGIEGLNIGYSEQGLKDYRRILEDNLIRETGKVLMNVNEIESAINAGWQGKSRDVFMEQLGRTIKNIINDLNDEYDDLNARFKEIENNYITQDEELMNS